MEQLLVISPGANRQAFEKSGLADDLQFRFSRHAANWEQPRLVGLDAHECMIVNLPVLYEDWDEDAVIVFSRGD